MPLALQWGALAVLAGVLLGLGWLVHTHARALVEVLSDLGQQIAASSARQEERLSALDSNVSTLLRRKARARKTS
jgi:hypothetical protein